MIIVNGFKQNTKDWYQWRTKGLGASEAPAVMGVSPWTTPFILWAEKTGLIGRPEVHPNAKKAMERGHQLEPIARARYTEMTGIEMEAVNCEHDSHAFIRASLDGYNAAHKRLLEIKCPGKADHAKALKGQVPDKYFPQLQQQFLVSGADSGDYFSFDGENGVIIPVYPDKEYIAKLEVELTKFWELVQIKIPPRSTQEDLTYLINQLSMSLGKVNGSLNALQALIGSLTI